MLDLPHVLRYAFYHPLQPPHQFKKFKYELPEAVEGRATVKRLSDDVRAREKELKVRCDVTLSEPAMYWPEIASSLLPNLEI